MTGPPSQRSIDKRPTPLLNEALSAAMAEEDPSPRRFPEALAVCPDGFIAELSKVCSTVDVDQQACAEAGSDWWPLGALWLLDGSDRSRSSLPSLPAVVARPISTQEVAAVLRLCNEHLVPVTPVAGRSGVCGGALSIHGGVALDVCAMNSILDVDLSSGVVEVQAGAFGDVFEDELRKHHRLTLGHWPQSIEISTVGGWLACRSAGQFSTRYGKIEDMVVGLEVVLADGSIIHTGGVPRAAVGPDLTQLFVGSEGTLGVITRAMLRCHSVPIGQALAAYGFDDFASGVDACRRILRRGATPAVLRLYDEEESTRNYKLDGQCALSIFDEADPAIIEATMSIIEEECAEANRLDSSLVDQWMSHRNDVSALKSLLNAGWVVDTIEVVGKWSILDELYDAMVSALRGIPNMRSATAHLSHSYLDGACLYFTFAARPPLNSTSRERCYLDAWQAAMQVVQTSGAAMSHHHGIGLNRHRFMADSLGPSLEVLNSIKSALDPVGILNPGKLGMIDRFGDLPWP